MRIIVDAFGGDNAPQEILLGCVQARQELGVDILLTGDKARLEACAKELGVSAELGGMEILPCGQLLTMEDEPTSVIREKSDSSMAVGLRALWWWAPPPWSSGCGASSGWPSPRSCRE